MLALLKKDFIVLKKSCAVYLALLVFYTIFGAVNGDFSMFLCGADDYHHAAGYLPEL